MQDFHLVGTERIIYCSLLSLLAGVIFLNYHADDYIQMAIEIHIIPSTETMVGVHVHIYILDMKCGVHKQTLY